MFTTRVVCSNWLTQPTSTLIDKTITLIDEDGNEFEYEVLRRVTPNTLRLHDEDRRKKRTKRTKRV